MKFIIIVLLFLVCALAAAFLKSYKSLKSSDTAEVTAKEIEEIEKIPYSKKFLLTTSIGFTNPCANMQKITTIAYWQKSVLPI